MPRSRYNLCPPGVLCIPGGLINTLIIVLIIVLLFLVFGSYMKLQPDISTVQTIQTIPTIPTIPTVIAQQQQQQPIYIQNGGDSRYDRAPQPLRDWMSKPEFPPRGGLTSMPINIPTQGLPESFQSVGIVNVGEQILPLYGRRTAGSNDRWNYYTRTDTYNPVPIPVNFQKRDCMDDVGCQEIMSGETIKIDALHKEGKTNIYRFDGPKYIPGLI